MTQHDPMPHGPGEPHDPGSEPHARPFLSLFFKCANAYLRVYRSADGARYLARCPKCGEEVRFRVGEGGTEQRTFEIDCRS